MLRYFQDLILSYKALRLEFFPNYVLILSPNLMSSAVYGTRHNTALGNELLLSFLDDCVTASDARRLRHFCRHILNDGCLNAGWSCFEKLESFYQKLTQNEGTGSNRNTLTYTVM